MAGKGGPSRRFGLADGVEVAVGGDESTSGASVASEAISVEGAGVVGASTEDEPGGGEEDVHRV